MHVHVCVLGAPGLSRAQVDEDLRLWLLGLDTDPTFDAPTEAHTDLVSKLFSDMVRVCAGAVPTWSSTPCSYFPAVH